VPTENGRLTSLWLVDLEFNRNLRGTIPEVFCDLQELQALGLRDNAFSGEIPACLGDLTKLRDLLLSMNTLTGTIPSELCQIGGLTSFVIQRNQIGGELPSCIGDSWPNLEVFITSENLLEGSIPDSFANLRKLRRFWVDDNAFTGQPLPILNQFPELKYVYLENNGFSGVVDETTMVNAVNLTTFDLSTNDFTANNFPMHLLSKPNLQLIDFSRNRMSGTLADSIPSDSVSDLRYLSIHGNSFSGEIPGSLHHLPILFHLDLSENRFQGDLPADIFKSTVIGNLFLSNNFGLVPGVIPPEVEQMTQLFDLSLKGTNRNGELPNLLGFNNIQLIDFDNNDLGGTVPTQYGALQNLRYLLLSRNPTLGGPIPEFFNTPILMTVLVDGTLIYGDFESVCRLPAFQGSRDFKGEEIVVADCGDTSREIVGCSCCQCCNVTISNDGCSKPVVAHMDFAWEMDNFIRDERNFEINTTHVHAPEFN